MNIALSPIKNTQFEFLCQKLRTQKQQTINFGKTNKTIDNKNITSLFKATVEKIKSEESEYYHSFVQKPSNVSLSEYNEIKDFHISCIYKAKKELENTYCGNITPEKTADFAVDIKKKLDKIYDKGKYRIISIGTSPLPVIQPLSYLGVEVIRFPVSGLQFAEYKDNERKSQILEKLLQRKKIDDDKINLIVDYVHSGSSLAKTCQFISEKFKDIKLIPVSIQNLLSDCCYNNVSNVQIFDDFIKDMRDSYCCDIANIPHFSIAKKSDCPMLGFELEIGNLTDEQVLEKIDNYSSCLARIFELCTLHALDKKGALKK